MPTYEYECKKCNHRFELFQSMTAEPVKTCPECSGPVKRLIGLGAGIIFKGSGFYCTDYKNASAQAGSKQKNNCESCCKDTDKPASCPKENN